MKLEINGIELIKRGDKSFVRISIGDYMYMDTPKRGLNSSHLIYNNLMRRIE